VRKVLELLGAALFLAVAGNAVSPRGLSWSRPLGESLRAQVLEAGLRIVELPEVLERLRDGSTGFIDSRKPEDFDTGALPGALNWPWDEDAPSLPPLPPGVESVVVYCANEFCGSALRTAIRLSRERRGAVVAVFVDGYEKWWNEAGIHETR
jgi:rhodanese-related sulfurtransferase